MHACTRAVALIFAGGLVAPTAEATNWLMLQGNEPAGSTDRFRPWGFIQPQYSCTETNNEKDLYLYRASEKVFGGQGARRRGWKRFGWYQDGERTLEYVDGVAGDQNFDPTRWGFGTTFRKGPYRAAAEYIDADGMIFNGSDGGAVPGALNNSGTAVASLNMAPDGDAEGYYLHLGYAVTLKVELDARYDDLDRLSNSVSQERECTALAQASRFSLGLAASRRPILSS